MSKQEDMKLSLMTSSVLDYLGFSKKQITLRSNFADNEDDQLEGYKTFHGKVLAVGSSGEGVQLADSDHDIMCILSDVICVDEGCDNDGELIILGTDYSKTAPGYTKVVSISMPDNLLVSLPFKQCCTYDILDKRYLISSEKLRDLFATIVANYQTVGITITQNGPAMTSSYSSSSDCDVVQSVQFYGGNYLRKWKERVKNYEWPSLEISKEVSEMEGYVVPIGDKQSDMQAFEWRICYTTAEKKLVLSLSDTQIKAYVLLKILAKSRLKPKCKFLTSYIIKNVIFWVMEKTNDSELTPSHLVYLIQKCLVFIKHCIVNNHLPNYMIPERNLLKGVVFGTEKKHIIHFLSDCLEEGGSIILTVPKLYHFIAINIAKPDILPMFGTWRDKVEHTNFMINNMSKHSIDFKTFFELLLRDNIKDTFLSQYIEQIIKHNPGASTAFLNHILQIVPDVFTLFISGKSLEYLIQLCKARLNLLKIL